MLGNIVIELMWMVAKGYSMLKVKVQYTALFSKPIFVDFSLFLHIANRRIQLKTVDVEEYD